MKNLIRFQYAINGTALLRIKFSKKLVSKSYVILNKPVTSASYVYCYGHAATMSLNCLVFSSIKTAGSQRFAKLK